MADTEKKIPYLTVNYKNMTFTINDAVAPTKQDNEDIERYLRAGYKMRHKSVKRTAQAKGNAITDTEIIEALKKDEKKPLALIKYLSLKHDTSKGADGKRNGGFFKAKAWYSNDYKNWAPDEKETEKLEQIKDSVLKTEEEKKAKKEKK